MGFKKQAVGPGGKRRTGQGGHELPLAGGRAPARAGQLIGIGLATYTLGEKGWRVVGKWVKEREREARREREEDARKRVEEGRRFTLRTQKVR